LFQTFLHVQVSIFTYSLQFIHDVLRSLQEKDSFYGIVTDVNL